MLETLTTAVENSKKEIGGLNSFVQEKRGYIYAKRIIDVFITLLFSLPILTLILLFSILVKIDSKGPAFYTQTRVGKDGKVFKIYKLRSMFEDSESRQSQGWTQKNDPRITKVGRFIRKYRIDELPQFYNIVKGDMSLIGPRPERPDLTIKFMGEVPKFEERLLVRPGITGLAQVSGGYEHSPKEKFLYDTEYISNLGFKQDFVIFLKTIVVVFTGYGSR